MVSLSDFQPTLLSQTASISSGQTTTAAIDLSGTTLSAIQLPATLTGTAITFLVATTLAGTYQTMIDSTGNNYAPVVAGGKFLTLDPIQFVGVQYIKIASNATEAAQRDLVLISRPM